MFRLVLCLEVSMENESKYVFREETMNDLAVRELADSRAQCLCRLQFERCNKNQCKKCSLNKQFNNCYNSLSDYDKQRLIKNISYMYNKYSLYPESWMRYKKMISYTISKFLIIFISLLVLVSLLVVYQYAPNEQPNYRDTSKYSTDKHNMIYYTVCSTKFYIKDYNNDGIINCIDYACIFKKQWDKYYDSNDCFIVRNYNPATNWHHLFIIIKSGNGYIYVEPWCFYSDKYLMKDNWSTEYNPQFNIYNETQKWLKQGR